MKQFNGHQLLISINSFRSPRKSEVRFNFDVLYQDKTNQIIQGLLKLLQFNFGVNPKPFFMRDYLELIKDWKWISAKRKMVDPNSAHMQGTQDAMESLGYKCDIPPEEKDVASEFLNKEHKKSYQKVQGLDNESVNTIEENAIQRIQKEQQRNDNNPEVIQLDKASTQSSVTMGSRNTSKSKVKAAEATIRNHYNQVLFEKEQELQKKKRCRRIYRNN